MWHMMLVEPSTGEPCMVHNEVNVLYHTLLELPNQAALTGSDVIPVGYGSL